VNIIIILASQSSGNNSDLEKRIAELENLLRPADLIIYNGSQTSGALSSVPDDWIAWTGRYDNTYAVIRVPFDGTMCVADNRHNSSGRLYKITDETMELYKAEHWMDQVHAIDGTRSTYIGFADYTETNYDKTKSKMMLSFASRYSVKKGEYYLLHSQRCLWYFWKSRS